ncbi:MAG TPA: dihydrofolate reductase family protein [Candidatus Sulfotelmatobacter sp.]|nr:dihydrofolate reductase family protein [Candidatus Sulfotelmatobacter sp.]HLM81846.1 dihydrofolate reductase family protein [Terriglobales bacterium]
MALVRTLTDRDQDHFGPALPPGLRELYDGDLRFRKSPAERPFVIANFVSTLDGVVSYEIKGQAGGSTVSGSDTADGFIMGLLRASADAVIVGARTVHDASPEALWIPEYTYPDAKLLFREYRVNVLHKPEYPLLVVVSGSGRLELERAIFRTPGVRTAVITTSAGSDVLVRAGAAKLPSVQIHALDAKSETMAPMAMLRLLYAQLGVRRLLHEGGPTLFGQFLGAKAIDELFLTLSPQIAGRGKDAIRPGLVQGMEFMPDFAPGFELLSVKQRAEHLYLRYQRTGGHPPMA